MIRILVTNLKGGCGKTTIATNLAGAFARGGLPTTLADVDRQRSSLAWLGLRAATAPAVRGVDWRKEPGEVPPDTARLVIDAPAAIRVKEVEELLVAADLVIVPVLPSLFDEASSARFLARLDELKPVRRGKKPVLVVANRLRARSRAVQRLETFLTDLGHPPVARLADRALYGELAIKGLSVFDAPAREAAATRAEWQPLLRAIEERG
jgi:chromosome partitioning protein